jgi:hypothetical protein
MKQKGGIAPPFEDLLRRIKAALVDWGRRQRRLYLRGCGSG